MGELQAGLDFLGGKSSGALGGIGLSLRNPGKDNLGNQLKSGRTARELANNNKVITESSIAELLSRGSRDLAASSDKELQEITDRTKEGESLFDVRTTQVRRRRPFWKGGGSRLVNRDFAERNDEQTSRFTSDDVDNILQAFTSRREGVRAATTGGGRGNSILSRGRG